MKQNITVAELAWLAGIIDGEGSIGAMSQHHKTENKTSTYRIRLRVTNTHKGLIEWLRLKIGFGTISPIKKVKEHYKQGYELSWTNQRAINIIRQIYPYMIIKRVQAEIAFEFDETLKTRMWPLSEEIVETRKRLRDRLFAINND